MNQYETISIEVDDDGVALLTLDRPDALNSFTVTMARELEQFFRDDATDDSIRAVVVTGAGRAFCAGMDLSAEGNVFGLDESLSPTPADLRDRLHDPDIEQGVRDTGGKVTLAIHELPKPVIAAINGAAVGIGATMTLAMDIRLASTKARIGFVFGRLGIVPEAASTWFLPRIVGLQQALEWVYSADILTADQALEGRLVRSLHEPDELVRGGARPGPQLRRTPLAGRARPGQAAALPQQRGRPPDRGAPRRQPGDVARQPATARKAWPPSGTSATPSSPAARASSPQIY